MSRRQRITKTQKHINTPTIVCTVSCWSLWICRSSRRKPCSEEMPIIWGVRRCFLRSQGWKRLRMQAQFRAVKRLPTAPRRGLPEIELESSACNQISWAVFIWVPRCMVIRCCRTSSSVVTRWDLICLIVLVLWRRICPSKRLPQRFWNSWG